MDDYSLSRDEAVLLARKQYDWLMGRMFILDQAIIAMAEASSESIVRSAADQLEKTASEMLYELESGDVGSILLGASWRLTHIADQLLQSGGSVTIREDGAFEVVDPQSPP